MIDFMENPKESIKQQLGLSKVSKFKICKFNMEKSIALLYNSNKTFQNEFLIAFTIYSIKHQKIFSHMVGLHNIEVQAFSSGK